MHIIISKRDTRRMVPDSSVAPSDRTRSTGHKLKHKKFHFNTRKNFFTLRVAEQQNRLLRDVVEFPSLETFRTHLDMFLCHRLWA